MIHKEYNTERLIVKPLSLEDKNFIFTLLNTENWLKYIGNRNIETINDAEKYINNLLSNPTSYAWVVSVKELGIPVGIITFLKKSYLDDPDIGFAFLPQFMGNGYAFESVLRIIDGLVVNNIKTIAAVTVKENLKSGALLNKLGFKPQKTLIQDNNELICYLYKSL